MTSIRRNLAQYLLRCNHYEMMGERVRQKIAENPYFQIETVFERFDKFKKGYLVPDDISEFMLDNKIYPTQIELYLIFRQFDKERAGVITLQQLAMEFLPKQNANLYKKATQRRYYPPRVRLEIDLQYIISKYFEHKIKQIKELTMLRVDMFKKQAYTVEQAFAFLDYERKGYLDKLADLDQFLRSNGKVLTNDELARIYRVLSFDKDAVISYETFTEQLDPLSRGYYIGYSQRIAEKHLVQQDYLKRRIQLKADEARNTKQKVLIANSIAELRGCNARLTGIINQQDVERRLHEQELLAYRMRRTKM